MPDKETTPKPLTQKQAFITYFQAMDLEMIELILDENITYQEATKKVYIEKISEVFAEFKTRKDTQLLVFKGVYETYPESDFTYHKEPDIDDEIDFSSSVNDSLVREKLYLEAY